MDTVTPKYLDAVVKDMPGEWRAFRDWYKNKRTRFPDQFPEAMPVIRWLMAKRGWEVLTRSMLTPHINGDMILGVPDAFKPPYDLNITERPFLVTVGEIVMVLQLAELHNEAIEFARRSLELVNVDGDEDFDSGMLYHIAMDYITSTVVYKEEVEHDA